MRALGICLSHDAGVAIVEDGKITRAVSEERFTRQKSAGGAPVNSLDWAIEELGGDLSEIDVVGVANRIQRDTRPLRSDLVDADVSAIERFALHVASVTPVVRLILGAEAGAAAYVAVQSKRIGAPYRRISERLREAGWGGPINRYDHHICHLLSGVFTAGWDECLSISHDFFGDARSGRVAAYRNGQLELLSSTPMYHSIGAYYVFATNLCGFDQEYHCGKTTGLAALGDGSPALDYFRSRIVFDERSGTIVNHGKFLYDELAEMRRGLAGLPRETIAAAVQTVTEEVLTPYVAHWARRTGLRRVALSGGIFANVKLNQRILELPEVDSIFVHPHMGDGGLAAGAAYAALLAHGEPVEPYRLPHVFLGPEVSGDHERALNDAGLRWTEHADVDAEVARLLAGGSSIARVTGRLEYGPRALGNRSILYRATDSSVNIWLNDALQRSEFMPFAPMVTREDAATLLSGYSEQSAHTAAFMTITYDVTERCRRDAPAVVHVDGTARAQVVDAHANPRAHRILEEYQRLSGLPALINTSFNIHEEPIVHTAEEAVQAFVQSGLDHLALENRVAETPGR